MSKLSELLKNRREERQKTLEDISSETKIRVSFLELIDQGKFSELPSRLHAYGFVKQYAESLGLPFEEIRAIFDEECPDPNAKKAEPRKISREKPAEKAASTLSTPSGEVASSAAQGDTNKEQANINKADNASVVSSANTINATRITTVESDYENGSRGKKILVLLVVLVVLCLIGWWGYTRQSSYNNNEDKAISTQSEALNSEQAVPQAEPVQDANNTELANVQADTANDVNQENANGEQGVEEAPDNPPVIEADNQAEANNAATDNERKRLTLSFSDQCWVHFESDSGEKDDFVAPRGSTQLVYFTNGFTIDIGNAAGITMEYNGQRFTNFGERGQAIKSLHYSLVDGVLTRLNVR